MKEKEVVLAEFKAYNFGVNLKIVINGASYFKFRIFAEMANYS